MKLKELVNIKIGLTLERKKANMASVNTIQYKALTLKSFTTINDCEEIPYEYFTASTQINHQYLTKANDVIIRLRTPNQAILISNINSGLIVPSIMATITNIHPKLLDCRYLAYYLNSRYVQSQLAKNIQGTLIPMIKIADLMNIEINLPPLEKQQKIVNCINIVDQEIDLLSKLINEKNKLRTEIFETLIR